MNLNVRLFDADSVPLLPPASLKTQKISWHLQGGPKNARLLMERSGLSELLAGWLGLPVEVRNHCGSLVWWGYIHALSLHKGGGWESISLEGLCNRVSVDYEIFSPSSAYSSRQRTAWLDSTVSQASFGCRERLLRLGSMSLEEANLRAESYLKEHAFPASQWVQGEGKDGDLHIECRGWSERLSWRFFTPANCLIGDSSAQLGFTKLGEVAQNALIAQSFMPKQSFDCSFAALRVRKEANPDDDLTLAIYADLNGAPGGEALVSGNLMADLIGNESYEWLKAPFSSRLSLEAGKTYWLRVSRSGALSTAAYYYLALDEGLNFTGGALRLYNESSWQDREPDADLLFKLGGSRPSKAFMQDVFTQCGAELAGISFDFTDSPELSSLGVAEMDGLQALRSCLDLGDAMLNPLYARVDPNRYLHISALASLPCVCHFNREGKLLNDRGFPVEEGFSPVGCGLRVANAQVLIQSATLDVCSGKYQINHKGR